MEKCIDSGVIYPFKYYLQWKKKMENNFVCMGLTELYYIEKNKRFKHKRRVYFKDI